MNPNEDRLIRWLDAFGRFMEARVRTALVLREYLRKGGHK